MIDVVQASPAPIDRLAVQRTLAPFGQSRTLPAEAYLSEDVFAWEQRHFFEEAWVCVGRVADLPEPGSMRAAAVGAEGILLVRRGDGSVAAFSNVCQHRGHELLGSGETAQARIIRCPYHAWVYNLDGTLRTAPSFNDTAGFDKGEYRLQPVPAAEWHGWLFLNATGDAAPVEEYFGNVEELIAPYEPERLVVGAQHDYVVEANWKLVAENYHECYHCTSIHPELCRVTPHNSGLDYQPTGAWAGGSMDLMEHATTMSLTGESRGVMLRGLSETQLREVLYIGLFPNLLVSTHPDYVMTHRMVPLGPGRTQIECQWLFPPEAVQADGFDPSYAKEFWDITNREDWAACEAVQRGVSYQGYRQGPLSPRESTVYQLLTMVARGYLEGRVSSPEVAHNERLRSEAGS